MGSQLERSASTEQSQLPFGFGEAEAGYLDKFQLIARYARETGTDPSTRNAAMFDRPIAMRPHRNHIPECFAGDGDIHDRQWKLSRTVHAEAGAIINRNWPDMTLLALWAICPACALTFIASPTRKLVTLLRTYELTPERWKSAVDEGLLMLQKAGREVEWFTLPLGEQMLMNGEWVEL